MAVREGKILLSFAVLAELYEVLSRKRFRRYVDEEDIRSFVAALTREAQWVDVEAEIRACRDPKDDKFLELAVSGRATHLVTGDSDLLALSPFQCVEIAVILAAGFPTLASSPDERVSCGCAQDK